MGVQQQKGSCQSQGSALEDILEGDMRHRGHSPELGHWPDTSASCVRQPGKKDQERCYLKAPSRLLTASETLGRDLQHSGPEPGNPSPSSGNPAASPQRLSLPPGDRSSPACVPEKGKADREPSKTLFVLFTGESTTVKENKHQILTL